MTELPETGRVLGLDYGTRRIGIAISDGLRLAAHPLEVVGAGEAVDAVTRVVEEYGVTLIVVGLPVAAASGDDTDSSRGARGLAEKLGEALDVPVTLYDERYTTVVAEKTLLEADVSRRKRKETVDKVAAAVMLQGYLDRSTRQQA